VHLRFAGLNFLAPSLRASLVLGCINYVLSSELSKKYLIAFWPNQRKLHQSINSHSRQLGKIESSQSTGIDSKEIFKGLIKTEEFVNFHLIKTILACGSSNYITIKHLASIEIYQLFTLIFHRHYNSKKEKIMIHRKRPLPREIYGEPINLMQFQLPISFSA